MQQYDFTAAANDTFPIAAAGRYIKYLSGNNGGGDVSITVTAAGQGASKIVLVPGQAFRVSDAIKTPSGWVLANNAGGATIAGTVVIGDGRIDDPTINGVVQVVDGGKARTLGGFAFAGTAVSQQVAGSVSRVQLWNPAGNTKRVVVEQITAVGMSSVNTLQLQFNAAALATVAEPGGFAKIAGATASSAQVQIDQTVATAVQANALMMLGATSNTSAPFKFNEPIVLPPGWGLLAWGLLANEQTCCNFEWYEEPNV